MKLRSKHIAFDLPKQPTSQVAVMSDTGTLRLKDRLKVAIVLGMSMLSACLISYFFLIGNSIRLDEAQSLWQTSHSIAGTLKVVAQDVHVPLYHLLLHFWQVAFGQTIETARLLSLLFFLATIPVVYLLARRVLSVNWSLFVTVLFSLSPFMNWYANEARMYTLLVLVATLSQLFFMRLIESKGRRGWLGYTLTAMVGIYAHYFFFFGLITQGIYFLATRKHFVKGTLLKFIAVAGLLALEFLPWFLYFRSLGSASNTSPNLQKPSSVDFFNVYSQFSFGFQGDFVNTLLASLWPLLVIAALLSVKNGQKISKKMAYILVAALAPVVVAFVVSLAVTPFFVSRYMVACVPPLLIAAAWFVSHYKKPLQLAVTGIAIVTLAGVSLNQYLSASTPVKEDFRSAARFIEANAKAHDVVVLSAPFTVYPFNYYYDGKAKVATLPLWNRSVPGAIPAFEPAKLDQQTKLVNGNHQYVYLLLSYDQGYEEEVYQYYEQRYENTVSHRFSPDLELHVYRIGYSDTQFAGEL